MTGNDSYLAGNDSPIDCSSINPYIHLFDFIRRVNVLPVDQQLMIFADVPIGVNSISDRNSKVIWYHPSSRLMPLSAACAISFFEALPTGLTFVLPLVNFPLSFDAATEAYEMDFYRYHFLRIELLLLRWTHPLHNHWLRGVLDRLRRCFLQLDWVRSL